MCTKWWTWMLPLVIGGALPQSGQWERVSDAVLDELARDHPESGDPYARLTAGISVDRTTGGVYLLANNIGICKSTDQGRSFRLVSGNAVTGRFETSAGLNIDPNGGRLMAFTIYGTSAYSPDAGKTWLPSKLGHLDYGAVDWADTGTTLLAISHESGGKLSFSSNAGADWSLLGAGYWGVGLYDRSTFFVTPASRVGILRSIDFGKTWQTVSAEKLASPVTVRFHQNCYWLGENGLLKSRDRGASWKVVAALPKGATLGPLFGKSEREMIVGAAEGLFVSHDAGRTWSLAAPPAPEINVLKGALYGTYGWDPIHGILYASQMSKPAYRYYLPKTK